MMAPFSSKSVITFEDIPVTKTARRFLIIENPTEQPLDVTISCKNSQKPIKNLIFEWLEGSVPGMGDATVEIAWTPSEAVACKETFFVTDQRGFKKELSIIFKSMGGKTNTTAAARKPLRARNGPGLLTVNAGAGAYAKRSKTPSPPAKKRMERKRLSPMNNPPYKAQKSTVMPRKTTPKRSTGTQSVLAAEPLGIDFNLDAEDDKENSPVAAFRRRDLSLNGSDLFDKIQFTPAAEKTNRNMDMLALASMPTPKLGELPSNDPRQPLHGNVSALSSKKMIWSPIFEGIREEVGVRAQRAPLGDKCNFPITPELVVTGPEYFIQSVSRKQNITIVVNRSSPPFVFHRKNIMTFHLQ